MDPLRNALLAGLGAIASSQEKLKIMLDGLIAKGDLTREQGEKVLGEWVERGKDEQEKIGDRVSTELKRLLTKLSLVPRDEFDELKARVERLEGSGG